MITEPNRGRSALVAAWMTARLFVLRVIPARLSCLTRFPIVAVVCGLARRVLAPIITGVARAVAAAVTRLLWAVAALVVTTAFAALAPLWQWAPLAVAIVPGFSLDVRLVAGCDRILAPGRRILVPATRPIALPFRLTFVLVYRLPVNRLNIGGARLRRRLGVHADVSVHADVTVHASGIRCNVAFATVGEPIDIGVAIAAARAPFRPTT